MIGQKRKLALVAFYAVALVFVSYTSAHAGPIEEAVSWVMDLLTSGISRSVAIIGCAVLGYMAFAGKLTWEKSLCFIGGIVLIFGGATIVDALIGTVA